MPQDGDSRYEESFNSFLAGVLLTRKFINNFEFFNLMNSFEEHYNITVVSKQPELAVSIYFSDNGIGINKNFGDRIIINNKYMTIDNYLYSFTTPRVREFMGIPPRENSNVEVSGFFRRILKKRIVT